MCIYIYIYTYDKSSYHHCLPSETAVAPSLSPEPHSLPLWTHITLYNNIVYVSVTNLVRFISLRFEKQRTQLVYVSVALYIIVYYSILQYDILHYYDMVMILLLPASREISDVIIYAIDFGYRSRFRIFELSPQILISDLIASKAYFFRFCTTPPTPGRREETPRGQPGGGTCTKKAYTLITTQHIKQTT